MAAKLTGMGAKKLNQVNLMPQINAAFAGWFSSITLTVITQTINALGFMDDTTTSLVFNGVVQPMSAEDLQLKPEGLRSFTWLMIHCKAGDLNLKTNDIIVYSGRKYKVMGVKDYSLNNYIQYDILEDYQND